MGAIKILFLYWLSLYGGFYIGKGDFPLGIFLGISALIMLGGVANDYYNRD